MATKRNFYEELKGKMSYNDMPQYAANELISFMGQKAQEMGAPVEQVKAFVKKYTEYVINNADNKSQMLRTFAEVISAASDKMYFRNALGMIQNNYIVKIINR